MPPVTVSSFGEDGLGHLYVIDHADGEVFRIVPEPMAATAAALACTAAAVPRLRLIRPPWEPVGDWRDMRNLTDTAAALPAGAHALLTSGAKETALEDIAEEAAERGANAIIAAALIGPIPGMVIRRAVTSSRRT